MDKAKRTLVQLWLKKAQRDLITAQKLADRAPIMKIDFDPEVDAAYLQLDDAKIVDSEEVLPGVVFDFDECGSIVGVELLAVKKKNRSVKLRQT